MTPGAGMLSGVRLDQWLVAQRHAATRSEAQAAIMAGLVTVDGRLVDKPGRRIAPGATVQVRRPGTVYASRGGLKLAHALEVFGIDVRGRVVVDLGASTGGFTDCLLRAGASRVYAVDVGRGQLAWRLRTDPRVVALEGVNARYLAADQVGGRCDLVTADLAFISLRLVWPAIAGLVVASGSVVALVKPQFEAGRAHVMRGGVVRDPDVHREVLSRVLTAARAADLTALGVTPSPITGPAGNMEYLVHLRPGTGEGLPAEAIDASVARAHAGAVPPRRP
ncbi:MAG TPA: TlyA family RNA methyltransferase [bacterium]|nr:TlyA family RNA methyltransferase [bacterium]